MSDYLAAVAFFGVGIIFMALFFVAIILGIQIVVVYAVIHAIRKYDDPLVTIDARSGKGKLSEVPAEIKTWNWAAAFIPMVWGTYHATWIFLLNYVPGVNLVWWIVMGIKGNEWAWRKGQWENVERFKRAQARWRPVGIVFFIINLLNLLWVPYIIFMMLAAPYNLTRLNNERYSLPSDTRDYYQSESNYDEKNFDSDFDTSDLDF